MVLVDKIATMEMRMQLALYYIYKFSKRSEHKSYFYI